MNAEQVKLAKEIWKLYVPKSGNSSNVYGELLRCVEKLRDEAQRNGNINFSNYHRNLIKFLSEYLGKESRNLEILERLKNENQPLTADEPYDFLVELLVTAYSEKSLGDGNYAVPQEVNFDDEGVVGVIGGDDEVEWEIAVHNVDYNKLKKLIESGWNINERGQNGFTALAKSAVRGHLELVKLLVENNADINAIDNFGESVLDCAVHKKEVKAYLKSIGAKSAKKK